MPWGGAGGRVVDWKAFAGVGLAVVQITLLISGDAGTAALAGGVAGLLNRGPVLKRGSEVRAGERVAKEIAGRVPSVEEYRRIEDHQWEAAGRDVAALLRDLPEVARREAGYNAEASRMAVLKAGGRERRDNLGDEEAKTAFDWLLGEACRQVAELFTDSEALRKIVDQLDKIGDGLGDIRDGQRRGQLVSMVTRDHAALLRSLAPDRLLDREDEIAALESFVKDEDSQWLAYTAPMLSGKTAVMVTFALHPPRGVRVVSYFVRRNMAGHDRDSFFFTIRAQLAEIVGDQYVCSETQQEQPSALAEDLMRATAACESRGERLVLLIDGLDEDACFEVRDGSREEASILSVLPFDLPRPLKVVTASRPNPPTPEDVKCEAWAGPIRRELSPSPHAEAEINSEDIKKFFGHKCGRIVGAFLAACEGQMTVNNLVDVIDLHDKEKWSDLPKDLNSLVDDLVGGVTGRLLNVMDIGTGRNPVMAYSLGHDKMLRETLRKLAPECFGEGDDPEDESWWAKLRDRVLKHYRETIVRWAEGHSWSRNSPSYLLGEGLVSVVRREKGDRGVLELLGVRERNDRIAQRNGSGYGVMSLIDEYANRYLEHRSFDCEEFDVKILLDVAEERQRLARSFPYIHRTSDCRGA